MRVVSLVLATAVAFGSLELAAQAPPPRPAGPAPRAKPTPLPPPGPFAGTVIGPDAKPVPDAVIVVTSDDFSNPPLMARTGADGRFTVQPRRRGPHMVRVEARGLAAQTLEKALPGVPLRVTLAKGGSIDGIVRDGATAQPEANARVEAQEDAIGATPFWAPGVGVVVARTDAKGLFKLEGLARGRHTITASSRRAGRATRSGIALGQRVDLTLVAGPSMGGRVLKPDGSPAAGAAIRAELEIGMGRSHLAGADGAGRFEIFGLSPGPYRVIAQHPEFAIGMLSGVRVDRGTDLEVDVVLAPGVRVTGRLVDVETQPLSGTVSLQEVDGQPASRALGALLRTDAGPDGRFVLERIPPGSHALSVAGSGVAARRLPIGVGARQRVLDLGDVVLEAGAQIRGRVREKAGPPIADASVRGFVDGMQGRGLPPLEARTEADGTFVLGGATASAYRVVVQAAGFAQLHQPVDAPSDGVELVLDAAGSIAGLVVDGAGSPVDAFQVMAQPSGGREGYGAMPSRRSFVSEGGRFTLDGVAPGTYAVEVSARDLGRQVVSDVAVAAGAVRDLGRIRLAQGGAVRGTVQDAAGNAVVGAIVEARGPERSMYSANDTHETATDAAGGFQMRGLPAGTTVVIARHPEFAEGRSAPVEVEPGRTAEASVVLSRGGRIEGVVRRRGGAGLPDALVHVRSRESFASFSAAPTTVTRSDGSFTVEHIAPGRVIVALMMGIASGNTMSTALSKEADIREDETARVEFEWREILLTGKVTRGGVALPDVRLTARNNSGFFMYGSPGGGIPATATGPQRMTAVTREDGSYEMIVAETGRMTIRAEGPVGRQSYPPRTIEVADVDTQTVDLDFPAGTISGIVVDEETDAPIARASVTASAARPGGPGGGPAGGRGMTGPEGRFTIDVDDGAFRVHASAEGYAPGVADVTVAEAPVGEVRIALARGDRLRGKVVDSRGRPVPGVELMALEEAADEDMDAWAESSLAGTFEFAALRPGRYSLAGGSALSGFGMLSGLEPGAADVVLRLSPGGRIRVSVTGPEESPVAGAFVTVRRVNAVPFSYMGVGGRTGADGVAESASPAGAIEIEVAKERLTGTGRGTVTAGGLTAIDVTLTEKPPPPAP